MREGVWHSTKHSLTVKVPRPFQNVAERGGIRTSEGLPIATSKLAGAGLEELKAISQKLTEKLTYLLEPIGLVEADADRCSIQLRSSPPQKGEDETSYYELMVRRGGDITLSRYSKKSGQLRQIVPANVTREVLARLADDFIGAVE